jgi:hypothetical protein
MMGSDCEIIYCEKTFTSVKNASFSVKLIEVHDFNTYFFWSFNIMMSKLGLYDVVAVVIPGILFLWGVSLFMNSKIISLTGGLAETSILVALGYVVGLILQGISQGLTEKILLKIWGGFPSARWLLAVDKRLSNEYKFQIKKIVEDQYFIKADDNLSKDEQLKKNQEIFYLCYNKVEKEKLSDRPQIFNAQYGLFRSLLTTFILLSLFDVRLITIIDG